MAMPEATIHQETRNLPIERVQIGVRMEKRMIKVLKGLAEYLDITLGDLLEGITLHAFESESPRSHGKPLSAQTISERLSLPLAQVIAILEDLQRHLFFLVLNPAGEVCWAYPVTCETTPHRLRFRSGERIYAA